MQDYVKKLHLLYTENFQITVTCSCYS